MKDKISLGVKAAAYSERLKWKGKRAFYKNTAGVDVAPTLVPNPLLKWPRNFRCVCGSGIKFKKCCLNGLASGVTIEDAVKIKNKLDLHRA